jgi:transposase-like protein
MKLASVQNTWAMTIVKWRALSLKRLVHLGELQRSGRWRGHFPTEEAYEKAVRSANADAERWKQLAHPNDPGTPQAAE